MRRDLRGLLGEDLQAAFPRDQLRRVDIPVNVVADRVLGLDGSDTHAQT